MMHINHWDTFTLTCDFCGPNGTYKMPSYPIPAHQKRGSSSQLCNTLSLQILYNQSNITSLSCPPAPFFGIFFPLFCAATTKIVFPVGLFPFGAKNQILFCVFLLFPRKNCVPAFPPPTKDCEMGSSGGKKD